MSTLLFVYAPAGPPLPYLLARAGAHGAIHTLLAGTPPPDHRALLERHCASVISLAPGERNDNFGLQERIVASARAVGADAILSFSELVVPPVAGAAAELGLRGAGPNVWQTRDKWAMREAYVRAGLRSPRYRRVESRDELLAAGEALGYPYVLKATGGAASVGHTIPNSPAEAIAGWESARALLARFAALEPSFTIDELREPAFIAEEIVQATVAGWFDDERFGDYVSVEALVCDGVFHPLGITTRLPTVHPFTERGNHVPCVLSDEAQQAIARTARTAVDALGLQFCGTHTEIKLLAGGELCVIETAARYPGTTNMMQIEEVYGVDGIGLLVEALLTGRAERAPRVMPTGPGRGATANLALLPLDDRGTPWTEPHRLAAVPWETLISPGTKIDPVWLKGLVEGDPIAPYDPIQGALNTFGLAYLTGADVATLLHDQYEIMRRLPKFFAA